MGDHAVELTIFVFLFLVIAVMGFMASRWKAGETMHHLDEWGLGGRKFGTWVSWFLIGGDLYTAYTFVAVPALMFGAGATGFFAVPYTVVLYPLVFLVLIRLWSVSHKHGFVTSADFVKVRFDSRTLALLVSVTGIVATMPYVALQLVGVQAVLITMGVSGKWPLVLAFLVLALFTYTSGLRAPALIAFVKDSLIYLVIIVAVIYIPTKLGGYDDIFAATSKHFTGATGKGPLLAEPSQMLYVTLALGSALALMLYPHSTTAILSAKSRDVVKRNMALLPLYSLMLGFLSLLGFFAIAAGVQPIGGDGNTIVPALFDQQFAPWFAGIAFAAIGIGALVPAAIMSIAAANTFTRNIYKEYFRPD
jgi:solute:Na+ symporter, SSS family